MPRDRSPRDQRLAELDELEARIAAAPDDDRLRWDALRLHAELEPHDARRTKHILWFVQNRPTDPIAATPYAIVKRDDDPAGHDAIERAWVEAVAAHPDDLACTRALAAFIFGADSGRARSLLRSFVTAHPADADAWFELGRVMTDSRERLEAYVEAQRRGANPPLLGEFLVSAALAAGDLEAARAAGDVLLAKAAALRVEHGDALDWTERGPDFWQRALAHAGNPKAARTLVDAHSTHANAAHYGHTAAGVVASSAGALDEAAAHLHESVLVTDFRMTSNGPSFRLAAELVRRGRNADVETFLAKVRTFWEPETVDALLDDLANQRSPRFPDT